MKKPIAVKFYSGPGAGKSTMAAGVFSELKNCGVNAELVTEFAKQKVWEEAYKVFECQMYVCAKQVYRMFTVSKHVDVIVTDSPILLGTAYNRGDKLLDAILLREYKKYNNIDIFLKRTKIYNPKGRMQTEDEAKEKDKLIMNILKRNKINFKIWAGQKSSINEITQQILNSIEKGRKNENY